VSEPSRRRPIIAIDGPAGAGKSTVAKRVADLLGYVLVDTGAMYRAVALEAQRRDVAWSDGPAVTALADGIAATGALAFERDPLQGVRVLLHGEDVSAAIRAPDIALGASTVSAHPGVRDALLDMQRGAGRDGGVVLEGRDIGTVVFPAAEHKFFLTARPEVRARRRFDELAARGVPVVFEQILEDVRRRDEQDTNRLVAPLRRAPDAVLVDSSDIGIDETVARIVAYVRDSKT
jgi:cytidylate kinase